ncbi:hypothetical protein CRH09_15540 [Nocardia terpenica]|uniref:Uncharacterized protein n=1 Tax=Nocardia terpenica TaxID=455432 RepID=A0A291RJD1_9NOCA|nr:hypothetical protein CRH09_15540 [Nocardia terpenica]
MDDHELVDLATRLRGLIWSWRMDDMLGLMNVTGWTVRAVEPGRITVDTRLGTADGYVLGEGLQADCLDVLVTGPATDDEAGRARLNDTFTRMTAALIDALGEPAEQVLDDELPRVCWVDKKTVLAITREVPYIHLLLTEL